MKNYIQPGDVLNVPAPANVSSGDGVLVGTLFGVAAYSALQNGEVQIKTKGVFELPKTSAQAWTVGAAIYWDNTAKVCTTSSSDTVLIGKAVAAADNPSDSGLVRLNG